MKSNPNAFNDYIISRQKRNHTFIFYFKFDIINIINVQGVITLKSKAESWDYALGIIKVDGLTPSDEFLELVEKEKNGTITTADMKKVLDKKYKAKANS